MGASAMMDYESFEVAFQTTNDSKGTAGQVVDLFDGHQAKRNDMKGMGGRAQVGDLGRLTELANEKTMTMCGMRVAYTDDKSREEQLKLDMVQAFGGEVAQMGEFIAEVMASLAEGSPLPEDQKDQLFEMVSEIVTLKNLMNTGALPEGQARLEAMIAQTATKIAETLLDGMDNAFMPAAIVDFVHGMLSNVGQQYDIPALNDALVKIEGRMNPENYLTNSVAEVIAQLTEMLESDDLSEEAQAEIESLIEKMEQAMEKGEPIPRDVMQALESLSENYPEVSLKSEFTQAIETLKDANIVAKAEALGLSVAQVQEIEATIEKLEAQSQDLNEKAESKAELESLIESLQAFVDKGETLTPEAAATIETIIESRADWTPPGFESPSVETPSTSTPSLSSVIASIAPSLATISPSPAKPTAANSNESSAPTPETSGDTPVTQPDKPSDPVEIKAKEPDSTPGENPVVIDPIDIGGGETPDLPDNDGEPQPDTIEKDDPTNNPETPSENDKPDQENEGGKKICPDGCDCGKAFNEAAKKLGGLENTTVAELKEAIRNQLQEQNPNISDREINNELIKKMDSLPQELQTQLIEDIAKQDFSGDVGRAHSHIEAVVRLQRHEEAVVKKQKEVDAIADQERLKRLEEAKKRSEGKTTTEEFRDKGCPQHGKGGCPEGSHGKKVELSQNKQSSRRRGLVRK